MGRNAIKDRVDFGKVNFKKPTPPKKNLFRRFSRWFFYNLSASTDDKIFFGEIFRVPVRLHNTLHVYALRII